MKLYLFSKTKLSSTSLSYLAKYNHTITTTIYFYIIFFSCYSLKTSSITITTITITTTILGSNKTFSTLPEWEEDDGLDGEELEYRVVGLEEVPCGKVEEEEAVEGQWHRDVVDDGDVEVATLRTVGEEGEEGVVNAVQGKR